MTAWCCLYPNLTTCDVTSRDQRSPPDTNRKFGISLALLSLSVSLVDESLREVCESQWIKRFGSRSNYKVTAGVNGFQSVSSGKTIINIAMWHFQGQNQGEYDIGRRPVELQIFTWYAKSGGVGSNPAQGNISFAHFSDRKICLSFPGTKYLDP